MTLGTIGAWLGGLSWQPAEVEREVVAEVEELGYGTVWFGEAHIAKEAFSHAGLLLAASRRIVVATGIANIWARDPMAMSTAAKTLAEAYPDRFLLGLGVSHPHVVAARGHTYERPLTRMREYLLEMDEAEYHGPEPAQPVTRVLSALRPRMLELSGVLADGAHPYFVPVEHTARAREILGSRPLLATEQAVLLETDPGEARRIGREHTSFYLTVVNYVENLRWLGWDGADLEDGGSDTLIDAIVAWGDEDAIRSRVQAHLDAGADHVCIQPLGSSRGHVDLDALRSPLTGPCSPVNSKHGSRDEVCGVRREEDNRISDLLRIGPPPERIRRLDRGRKGLWLIGGLDEALQERCVDSPWGHRVEANPRKTPRAFSTPTQRRSRSPSRRQIRSGTTRDPM